jgi:hypothetical protein
VRCPSSLMLTGSSLSFLSFTTVKLLASLFLRISRSPWGPTTITTFLSISLAPRKRCQLSMPWMVRRGLGVERSEFTALEAIRGSPMNDRSGVPFVKTTYQQQPRGTLLHDDIPLGWRIMRWFEMYQNPDTSSC